jgi:hypothetical protein
VSNIARIPITNIYMGGDYTGRILVGAKQKALNVILDTGSSALAIDGHKYTPDVNGGDKVTDLAQTDSYGDGSSWTGAVINVPVAAGTGASLVSVTNANVAIAYDESANMFRGADGILGLAYAPLDSAFKLPTATWPKKYTSTQVRTGESQDIPPYLTQLSTAGVVSDKVSFLTRRSFVHEGGGALADDPLNQGWMIVGGGEESTDLFTGSFQTVKVLADECYCTNLKSVQVGSTTPIHVKPRGPKGMPSNSIVDSGTNSLNLSPGLLKAILSKFDASQQALLGQSVLEGRIVAAADLDLKTWPSLTFVLQGLDKDVTLVVSPANYWQINAPKTGAAMAAITMGEPGLAILGLPIMNGYFTIFDGEADGGRGVIKFATSK